ncbi:hypothetical protein ACP70R_004195 [Stipagrostis hirtigluma subsp. patula]
MATRHANITDIVPSLPLQLLLLVALTCGASAAVDTGRPPAFVRARGTEFTVDGAEPFLFNGFNSYWMMGAAAEPSTRGRVTEVMRAAAGAGLAVCRTWAFADGPGYGALQTAPGVYDEKVFQGLDFVVWEARRHGVRLILSLVNNYRDFGGRPQYVRWARAAGVGVAGDDDFYTNPVVMGYYKNHVKTVLTRVNTITGVAYKEDPTIMAWELINEPRCQSDYSGRTVNAWVQEMATYVKSIDGNHLLEAGLEGFYGDSSPEKKQYNPGYQVGADYITNNLIPEIDFATIHIYPDQWLPGQSEKAQDAFTRRWIRSHWQDARAVLRKPLVLTEFGKSSRDPGYGAAGRDAYIRAVYRSAYGLARAGGGALAGAMVWQVVADGMARFNDGYGIVLSRDAAAAAVIAGQSQAMSALERTLSLQRAAAARGNGACMRD